ncbi:hypothetical protein BUALT_Bualt06G0008000 [Buddleja alternifolia]|uniref:Uncharacterized protein n=1 Tax=Buddleja alternifolia TaxID=168488 RepID=A0AAV6XB86_9LAMI|nr:hypothetical protein BUALT_Bualt06G0008000 [Buddleja alternifolia]
MAAVKLSGVQQPLATEFCSTLSGLHCFKPQLRCIVQMVTGIGSKSDPPKGIIDSHLHVWASPQQAAEKYPYFLGQEPTLLFDVEFLLQSKDVAAILRIMRWATSYDIHTEYSIESVAWSTLLAIRNSHADHTNNGPCADRSFTVYSSIISYFAIEFSIN